MTLNEWLMNSCFSLGHSPTKKYYNIKGITQILGSASHVLWICLIGHTYSKKKKNRLRTRENGLEATTTNYLEDDKQTFWVAWRGRDERWLNVNMLVCMSMSTVSYRCCLLRHACKTVPSQNKATLRQSTCVNVADEWRHPWPQAPARSQSQSQCVPRRWQSATWCRTLWACQNSAGQSDPSDSACAPHCHHEASLASEEQEEEFHIVKQKK